MTNKFAILACAAILLLMTACDPIQSRELFPSQSPTPDGTQSASTATASMSPDASPEASASPADVPIVVSPTGGPISISPATQTTTPSPTPSPTPTATPTPTPSPTPAPRFKLADNVSINYDGVSKYARTLIRTGSAINELTLFAKLLGQGYQTARAPSVTMRSYVNGTKSLTVTQYTYLFQDTARMDDTTPMAIGAKTAEEMTVYATNILSDLFPQDMLTNPLVTDTATYSDGVAAITVQYTRSMNGALIDDNMEGVTVSLGARGIRELHFQWCTYSGDTPAHPTDLSLAVQTLNREQSGGAPVLITSAELVYKPGSMGVDYTLYWRFTGAGGEVFDLKVE